MKVIINGQSSKAHEIDDFFLQTTLPLLYINDILNKYYVVVTITVLYKYYTNSTFSKYYTNF